MSLNLNRLEKVRHLANGSVEARCPACAEGGHDRTGEHLWIKADGRFGCCAHPKDTAHRKRIFALAGDSARRTIAVKPPAVKVAGRAVVGGVLGRLGRVFVTPAIAAVEPARTPRTAELISPENEPQESRTLRTPLNTYTCGEENQDQDALVIHQGVCVGVSAASELPAPTELEQGVRGVRLPHFTPGGTLVIPFDSPERFHWWKGGQSTAETRREVLADGHHSIHPASRKETHDATV